MWIEIAEAGAKSSFKGSPITYSTDKLDRTASSYNPRYHEAPVVIGDPTESDPAYGWVKALRREGAKLLASIEVSVPLFGEYLKQGKYLKKKIELYPASMGLRRVRFYGPKPPGDGLSLCYREGGDIMFFEYDERKDDPGEILKKKVIEMLMNPPRVDEYGRPIDSSSLTYSKAFEIVCRQNPELTQRYIDYLDALKKKNSPYYVTVK